MTLLSPSKAQEWFQTLPRARQIATLSPDYVVADAARDVCLSPFFLGYREGDSFWLHGVHRGRVEQIDCWDFQSPYGYGGPVTNCEDQAFLARAWSAYSHWCQTNRVLVEFVRLHPLAVNWQPYGGEIRQDRSTVIVPLRDTDIRAGYEVRCRTAVRKAEKAGLVVEEQPRSEITSRFADFYRQGMIDIGGEAFYLFNDAYFSALAELMTVTLLVCRQGKDWLSAGLFLKGGMALEYHLSSTTQIGRKLSATNLLLDVAASWGRDRGLESLYLGGGTDGQVDNLLLFFKSGFSAARLPFRYAFCIHQPEPYGSLRESYQRSGGKSSRVMFYR